ncbi:PREDICTED: olfactory receptor 1468-like [Nanorana parkeri]|uniref:olfactory receptor 1468-like n=1 Tax=Nanorana parkeri TaxID=125878 RepID=UPI0008549168|nr:PREDICTED: olfactory receptor 1468-like [Nanorana parkeri]
MTHCYNVPPPENVAGGGDGTHHQDGRESSRAFNWRDEIMEDKNVTRISTICLLGFQTPEKVKLLVFFLFLITYCVTFCGNLLIITLVSYSKTLQSPMYFFLSHLAMSDILLATTILPNTMQVVLMKDTVILFSACITQFYFFCVAEMVDSLLLTVMSYDRYLAICKPLHYNLLMSHRCCCVLVVTCWTLSFIIVLVHPFAMYRLQLCGTNTVDHFFCDLDPILELSCSDTAIVQLQVKLLSVLLVVIPFLIIIVSYVYIIVTIVKISSINGRQQVFSTCSSHLTVVSIYYGSPAFVYLVPSRGSSWNITKFLSMLYTIACPLINPLVYTLRNKDLKKVAKHGLSKLWNGHFSWR